MTWRRCLREHEGPEFKAFSCAPLHRRIMLRVIQLREDHPQEIHACLGIHPLDDSCDMQAWHVARAPDGKASTNWLVVHVCIK
ncbi:hypothetical protein AK812_SmicGene20450 [Symbiodinium microadriaticum]|uniref:Uncharacterized protein n=1 Tax=Symbiodinium microadriaticum TaxID=2951 RepID=A0A1Q9DPX7_SYMMI|nr:hypothetical protein AK812_SmicGene20450 [Symbiodinium microadriaticum]